MRAFLGCILAAVLFGCRELPMEPAASWDGPGIQAVLAPSRTSPTISCTRSWANGIDGDWDDPGMWSPVGVPGYSDAVCIKAAGSYTVTFDDTTTITQLQLGGNGADAALRLESATITPRIAVIDTFSIKAGGHFTMADGELDAWPQVFFGGGGLIFNGGTITLAGSYNYLNYRELINTGRIEIDAPSTLDGTYFENNGTIEVNGPSSSCMCSNMPVRWEFRSGRVTGTQQIRLNSSVQEVLLWTGGRLDALINDSTRAVVNAYHPFEIQVDTAARGLLSALNGSDWQATRIVGSIGHNAHVQLRDSLGIGFDLTQLATNWGTLEVLAEPSLGVAELELTSLQNRGTLDLTGGGEIGIDADSIVNRRTTTIDATVKMNAGVFRNRRSVVVAIGAELEMLRHATFQADSGSVMTGSLVLREGRVTGTGTLGFLRSLGGTIEPGLPIGALATGSVLMDSASHLVVEVSGTKLHQHDQLAITGSVIYDGTLHVLNVPPLTTPACGMVVPVATHTWVSIGNFHTLRGTPPGPPRGWRPHYGGQAVKLAGFAAAAGVTFGTSVVALSEGGAARSYFSCLGTQAPTGNVVVNAAPALGQLEPISAIVFALADWQLPRTLSVRALDDANVEPPHTDTVQHTLVSTDPNYDGRSVPAVVATIGDNDGSSDLELTRVSFDGQALGSEFTVTFRVANLGPSNSTGSTLAIPTLIGLEFVAVGAGATCSVNGTGGIACSLGAVAAGAQLDFTLTFRGISLGVHSNTLTLVGHQSDPATANNMLLYTQLIN